MQQQLPAVYALPRRDGLDSIFKQQAVSGNGSAGRGSCISRGAGFPQLQFLNYLRYQGVEVRVVDEHLTTQASADKG